MGQRGQREQLITPLPPPDPKQDYLKNTNKIVRHNPWGSISYRDMITDAILDQPDRKAKLATIYEFMINNYRKVWSNREFFYFLKQLNKHSKPFA